MKIPDLWKPYELRQGGPLEIVPWVAFDTGIFQAGTTVFLDFFNKVRSNRFDTNMWMPNTFPQPMALLVERVMIDGLSSSLVDCSMQFIIGSKVYFDGFPAVHTVLRRRGLRLEPKLMIAPLVQFSFRLSWPSPVPALGRNILGHEQYLRKIQVSLCGQLARPIQ